MMQIAFRQKQIFQVQNYLFVTLFAFIACCSKRIIAVLSILGGHVCLGGALGFFIRDFFGSGSEGVLFLKLTTTLKALHSCIHLTFRCILRVISLWPIWDV